MTTATVSVMFTDMVGSTALMSRIGPDAHGEVRRKHFELLRGAVASFGGTEVKSEGDALMVVFASASDALGCGVAMQQRVERHNRRAEEPVGLRVAIALGETNVEDGDYFGPCVVEAARLVSVTEGGQLLVSGLIAMMVSGRQGFEFGPPIAVEAKGFPEPLEARLVRWSPEVAGSTIPLPIGVRQPEGGLVMVGRDEQLARLRDHWKQAVGGVRQVVLVSGEPGVGKTRLASELAAQAACEGATVLFGRCDEDVATAYQPFAEALGHFVEHCPLDVLRVHAAAFGGVANGIVPELGRRLGAVPEVMAGDPQSERRLLFDALTALLRSAAEDAPVLLILDDLHWASKPTLLLFRHLLRAAPDVELLVLGTYRDTDLDRSHPLAELLGDLRRAGTSLRVALGGLDAVGVHALVEAAAGEQLDERGRALADSLFAETDGNPFFAGEVLRHLSETGAVHRRDGRWVSDVAAVHQLGIPEGIREVVGRRMARLSDDANTMLTIASVIGSEFELAVVEAVSGLRTDQVLDAVDEVLAARLVAEVDGAVGRCRFGHALVRQTLYAEASSARRAQLHRRVGEALAARHSADLHPHLGALALHFAEGARAGDTSGAVDWALRAAEQLVVRTAFEEAEPVLRRGLSVLEFDTLPDPDRKYDLLMALAGLQLRMVDRSFRDSALAAAGLVRDRDPQRLARAAKLASRKFAEMGRRDAEVEALCEEALLALGDRDEALRVEVTAGLSFILGNGGGDPQRVLDLAREAYARAVQLGDPAGRARAAFALGAALSGSPDLAEQYQLATDEVELSRAAGDAFGEAWAREARAGLRLCTGDRAGFEEDYAAVLEFAERTRSLELLALHAQGRAMVALLEGRFDEVPGLAQAVLSVSGNDPSYLLGYFVQSAILSQELGRLDEFLPGALDVLAQQPGRRSLQALVASFQAEAGALDEARRRLASIVADGNEPLPRDGLFVVTMTGLTDACAWLEDRITAAGLLVALLPYSGQLSFVGCIGIWGSVDRSLGMLETLTGDHDAANAHFEAATSLEESIGGIALVARTRYWHARLLTQSKRATDRVRAHSLLESCLATAQQLGMASLESQAQELAALMA